MKLQTIAILALSTVACTAQPAPGASIAVELYKSCMVGFTLPLLDDFPLPPKEIDRLAKELDAQCTQWTYIWLPGFLDKGIIADLAGFEYLRPSLLKTYTQEMKLFRP